jgi:outer membrane protein assembly factor BamA
MIPKFPYHYFLLLFLLISDISIAQLGGPAGNDSVSRSNGQFEIGQIYVEGNAKTKADIIIRELPFITGQNYNLKELSDQFDIAKKQLMNTMLFHDVHVTVCSFEGNKVDIAVNVKERWYLFPVPYFKPIDRNLNQWLIEQKADLSRVNYGLKLMYYNASGHNDKFRFWLINGYSKQLALSYDRLYIDHKMKWGFRMGFAMGKEHELNYATIEDKQAFLRSNTSYLHKFFTAGAELTYRNKINTRHAFGISYLKERVADTVLLANSNYFGKGQKQVSIPELHYTMTYYNLDYIPYPTKGYAAKLSISKKGLEQKNSVTELQARGLGIWSVIPKTFLSIQAFAGLKLPFDQPYFNQRFLGYGDAFLQGYEYYVVDGVAGGFSRVTLTRSLFDFNVRLPKGIGKTVNQVPFKVYAKVFENSGYVYNPNVATNSLSNKWLHGGGIGIDIMTLYDFTFRFEYSFNQLGQNGLFLHRKTIF